MEPRFDFPDVDWENADVRSIFEFFQKMFEQKKLDNAGFMKEMEERFEKREAELVEDFEKREAELVEDFKKREAEMLERIRQLEKELDKKRGPGRSRSYNVREYKDYPRPKPRPKPRLSWSDGSGEVETVNTTLDDEYCPKCGDELSDPTGHEHRTCEDIVDGKWRKTKFDLVRRYCRKCARQHTPKPQGVLPRQHFGNAIMAQVAIMHHFGISFGVIELIKEMIHVRHVNKSTFEHMFDTVADVCAPVYDSLLAGLKDEDVLGADETTWFFMGKGWWAWTFVSDHTAVYHISPSRGKMVPEAILGEFSGILLSDSLGAYNTVGGKRQKCLLHYYREMHSTRARNKSREFRKFYNELEPILKDAISSWYDHLDGTIPHSYVEKLLGRIDAMISGNYKDHDCKRFVKRLRRERDSLFTFLEHPVEYHNNRSERAVRVFATLRKIIHGSRSKRGLRSLEIITTIISTCQMRGINPYRFLLDLMDGKVDSIPMPEKPPNTLEEPLVPRCPSSRRA